MNDFKDKIFIERITRIISFIKIKIYTFLQNRHRNQSLTNRVSMKRRYPLFSIAQSDRIHPPIYTFPTRNPFAHNPFPSIPQSNTAHSTPLREPRQIYSQDPDSSNFHKSIFNNLILHSIFPPTSSTI